MRIFYTRLTKGRDVINLTGEACMENLLAAAAQARELLADGWTFVPQAQLVAEMRRATIPEPRYCPAVQ